jgi:cytochrome P450
MRRHGCQPILKYPHTDRVLGTDLAEKMNKARKDGDLMKRWPEIYKAAGGKTFEANIVGKKTLMTMDSKNIQTITATQLDKFRVEPTRGRMSNGWWGKGVFFSDDPHWSIGRKTIKPIFLRSQIGDLSGFGKHVSRMIELIPHDGSTVDLQNLVLDMVSAEQLTHFLAADVIMLISLANTQQFMDSSNEWLFGYSSETLDNGPRSVEARQLLAALNVVRVSAVAGLSSGPIAIIKKFFLGDKKLEAAKREIDSQIDKYISHALERREKASAFPDKLSNPSSSFIFIDQLVNQSQDRKFIRDQLMSVWIGSQDTSGLGASSIMFFLARYPEVWTKLRSEVLEHLGIDRAITFEELKSIKYLQWVMNEG